jgi:hypothetical protein
MRAGSPSTDDRKLAALQAPPDLSDGVQSLAYWRERSRRLSWYRIRARREAERMTRRWEQRVRAALVSQRGVPLAVRASAGLLVARTRLRWWSWRAAVVVSVTVMVALLAAPAVAALLLLIRAL